jgi:hypothetical protein
VTFAFAIQLGFGGNSMNWESLQTEVEIQQFFPKRVGILALGKVRPIEFRKARNPMYIITSAEATEKKLKLRTKARQ